MDGSIFPLFKPNLDEIIDTINKPKLDLIGSDNIIIQKFIIPDLYFFNEWLDQEIFHKESNELNVITNNLLSS